jgi:uncharacterized protein YegP (UPF0339 family)
VAAHAQFRQDYGGAMQSGNSVSRHDPAPLPVRANDLDPWRPARPQVEASMYFEIYRAEHVQLTSILCNGGDWRWRFCTAEGAVVAGNGGYRTEADCMDAVNALRRNAGTADFRRRPFESWPQT